MKQLDIQSYYDANIDSISITKSENSIIEGLKILSESSGEEIICRFIINQECELIVKCLELDIESTLKLMKLNWVYENPYWVYYE